MHLQINLLGRFGIAVDGVAVEPATRKAAAVVAVLAHAAGQPVPRERLAAMLWPRADEAQARCSLRQAVAQVRRCLGGAADRVESGADALRLAVDGAGIDLVALEGALARGDCPGRHYRGAFLDDLALREEPFEDWRRAEAARLDQRVTAGLSRRLEAAVADGDGERALELGERLLALDRAHEDAHAALIRLHLDRGALGSAMRQYEQCRAALDRVYGVPPSAATEALRRRIVAPAAGRRTEPSAPAGPPVVAVLPFSDLSDGAGDRHLAQGIAEDVTTELSRFRALRVIARHSAFAVAEAASDAADAGRRLGARYVLTGSVRRSTAALRVVVELIDVATGHYVWSHRYDFGAGGVGTSLADIARSVVGALAPRIDEALLQEGRRRPIDDLGTYDLWLQALARLRRGTADDHAAARGLLDRALAADPDCARAHAGLSLTYFNEWSCHAWDRWEENAARARHHAEAAVARDPTDHVTHAVLGRILLYRREFERAERHVERALALNPNDADMLVQSALSLAYLGDPARGIATADAAIRLNPFHDDWYFAFAAAPHLVARDFERLVGLAGRAPDAGVDVRAFIAVGHAMCGRADEAARQMARFLDHFRCAVTAGREPAPDEPARWILHVNPLRRADDRAALRDGLARAGLVVPPDAGEEPAPG